MEFLEVLKTYAGIAIAIGGGLAAFIVTLIGWKSQLRPQSDEDTLTLIDLEKRLGVFRTEVWLEIDRRCSDNTSKIENVRTELLQTIDRELRHRR